MHEDHTGSAAARRHDAALNARIDTALNEAAAAQACHQQVVRAARTLDAVPNVGAAAAATRFAGPGATRLRTELIGMAGAVRTAGGRLDQLAALLLRAAQDAELRAAALEARRMSGAG